MFIRKLTNKIICDYGQAEVKTESGILRGLISDDTYVFRGVKYADAERFGLPVPPAKWDGVKEAITYGFVCPEVYTPIPHDMYNVPHYFGIQSEDCQYLNIWTSSINSEEKMPVMVWLHGGGYATGSGIEHYAYDGENMAKFGKVVVITLNHRLNVLGHLNLAKYGEKYKYSANLSLLDIVAALEWIKANISNFGGNPDNVTIFGQSGGGGKVATLLQMPCADGLFHKAIIQSGVLSHKNEITFEESANFADKVVANLGLNEDNIDEIKNVPYRVLAQAVKDSGDVTGMSFTPVKDGEIYVGNATDVGIREHAKHIPMIVGTTFGEFSGNFNRNVDDGMKNRWSQEKREKVMYEILGDKSEEVIEAFRKAYPRKNIVDALFADTRFRRPTLEYCELRSKSGCANTYNYIFALESELYGGTVAWHNSEIPYVFRNADYLEASYIPKVTEWLQDIMCTAWTSFAKNGVPTSEGIPDWIPFSEGKPAGMIFDRDLRLEYAKDIDLILKLEEAGFTLPSLNRAMSAKNI